MSAEALALLDEMNQTGRISYGDYSALHNAVSALIPEPPTDDSTNTLACAHDWVDGSCGATAPKGTRGWERRIGPNGDVYWLCPKSAAEFPLPDPPADDEREALDFVIRDALAPLHIDYTPWHRIVTVLLDAILASPPWRNRHRGPITNEAVEAAARAIYDQATALRPDAWDREDEKERSWWREHARAVLEAARATS